VQILIWDEWGITSFISGTERGAGGEGRMAHGIMLDSTVRCMRRETERHCVGEEQRSLLHQDLPCGRRREKKRSIQKKLPSSFFALGEVGGSKPALSTALSLSLSLSSFLFQNK
jgi:hypothetical protein